MTAKIINLSDYRRSTVRCPVTGLVFPQLYRASGVSWKQEADGGLVPDHSYPWTFYTLSDQISVPVAEPQFEPISQPDARIDSGWIIVRHHRTPDLANGYISALCDLDEDPDRTISQALYQTNEGWFTLAQARPRKGCPHPLLQFTTVIPHDKVGEDNWSYIVDTEGNVFDDFILYPPEQSEENPGADGN